MKHILTLATLVLATSCFGQVPGHVPTDGLVAWWPFEVDGQDLSGNGNHLAGHNGVQFVGQQGAFDGIYLDGVDDYLSCIPFNGIDGSSDHSLAFWTSGEIEYGNRWILTEYNAQANANKSLHCGLRTSYCSESETGIASAVHDFYQNQSLSPCFSETTWNHWVMTFEREDNSRRIYKNGILIHEQIALPYQSNLNDGILVGAIKYENWDSPDYSTSGFFDDVGIWNRSLLEGEVTALYQWLATPGCMEENACNYDPEALWSDGTCDMVSCHCLEGTAWDESLEGCIPLVSAETACGEGTVWDTEAQHCVIANPSDTDFDGCVSMTDLLDLLTVFGTCNETPWSCGDPLEYQDYDYETVQIGEQCWFAENLRTSTYRSGETIALWDYEGEVVNPGIGHYTYKDLNPDNVDEFGLLYTWHTTSSVCPSGWHVPLVEEFELLLEYASQSGFSSNTPEALQSTSYWPSGLGVDAFGFNALPGGERTPWGNLAPEDFEYGFWWMSDSSEAPNVFHLSMSGDASENFLGIGSCDNPDDAMSIRCLKDSE